MSLKLYIRLVFFMTIIFFIAIGFVMGGFWFTHKYVMGKSDSSANETASHSDRDTDGKKNPLSVLVVGLHPSGLLTDFIMLARYNPNTKNAVLLSIPRDTKVDGTADGKINSAYALKKDINLTISKVKDITGIKADHYIIVDISGFRKIIDAIGGVNFDVPINMDYDDNEQNLHIFLNKGLQTLNGDKAEQLIRFRKNNDGTGYFQGDVERIEVQHKFMQSCISQLLKPANIIKIPWIMQIVFENIKTDFTMQDIISYIGDVAKLNKDNVSFATLPGEGKYIDAVSYYIYDEKKTKELIQNNFIKDQDTSTQTNTQTGDKMLPQIDEFGTQLRQTSSKDNSQKIRVEIINAANKKGLINKAVDILKSSDVNIVKMGNTNTTKTQMTTIIDRTDKGYARKIKDIIKIGKIVKEYGDTMDTDVTLILGQDF